MHNAHKGRERGEKPNIDLNVDLLQFDFVSFCRTTTQRTFSYETPYNDIMQVPFRVSFMSKEPRIILEPGHTYSRDIKVLGTDHGYLNPLLFHLPLSTVDNIDKSEGGAFSFYVAFFSSLPCFPDYFVNDARQSLVPIAATAEQMS